MLVQYSQLLAQRELAERSEYNYQAEFNDLYLTQLQDTLIQCIDLELQRQQDYLCPQASYIMIGDRNIVLPQLDPTTMYNSNTKQLITFYTGLANIFRQNGRINDALQLYRALIKLNQQPISPSIPSILSLVTPDDRGKQQNTTHNHDYPDMRVPFLCALLTAGKGIEVQA